MRSIIFLLAVLSICASSIAQTTKPAENFLYKGPAQLVFAVTPSGLSEVRIGERVVASGPVQAVDGGPVFFADAKPLFTGPPQKKTMEILSPNRVRVRHEWKDVAARYDYTFSGEDVSIKVRIENNTDQPMRAVGLEGPQFDFTAPPAGLMNAWHISYTQNQGPKIAHPSHFVRIGGSYAADETFGVGLTPLNTGLSRTLLLWDWVPDNEQRRQRRIGYYVPKSLPAGDAATIELGLRISPNRDWKHLLEPYKRHFDKTLGPVQYRPDHRPFAQFASAGKHWVKADNPFGFNGPNRRFDTAKGTQAFCDMVIPGLKAADGQGVMFWALQGDDPRGAMYRPDFDIFPQPVEANIPLLRKNFEAAGLRLGLCARPGEIAIRADRDHDMTLQTNPDDPAHMEMMTKRFKRAIEMGFSAFYLDSFGCSLEDVKAMRHFRAQLGPDVPTYAEMTCDWILPYSGAYLEVGFDKKLPQYTIMWFGPQTWEIMRWLVPEAVSMTQNRVDPKDLPAGFESPYEFMYRKKLTPLSQDWIIATHAPQLKALADNHLETKGKWRP